MELVCTQEKHPIKMKKEKIVLHYKTIKCYNNEKIEKFNKILADDKSDYIDDDMNLLFASKNTISILNKLTRKKRQLNKNYEILRELSRNQMETEEKKISLRANTKGKKENTSGNKSQENVDLANEEPPFVGANEEAANDKEVQQEVNKTDEEVGKRVDVPNVRVDATEDNEKDDMEKKKSRSTDDTSNEKLDNILSSSGDYIVALMLNNYKYRMRSNHLNEKFWNKVQDMASKSDNDLEKAKNDLQKEIQSKFGDEFINEVASSLKTLAQDINPPL
ncbi:hypothetical protein PV326_000049 [Microctonus aethiopoides]|nr:hypothetical protein PV326_000049 [Microctonus aethiopoides]